MSLWWARREQLDKHQVRLIEELPLNESCLVLGPPGSGKTNVLLRRAQFVSLQDMPNVLVLSYTRALTEFIKTGCLDAQGREIFPRNCVVTIESWLRWLYGRHKEALPEESDNMIERKKAFAAGALPFKERHHLPLYDSLFVDEAQDLVEEEIKLLAQWSQVLFFVGDSRQKLFRQAEGLDAVRRLSPRPREHTLPFHYRLAPKICRMADRILMPEEGGSLAKTSHYEGPIPGEICPNGPISKDEQLRRAAAKLKDQIRVYADLIQQGDRLGVVVAWKYERENVLRHFEQDSDLHGKSKIIRARTESEIDYDPTFDPDVPILILTVAGCKGLEFRALHWLFCEELSHYHDNETYYTVVTRSKTSLDLYFATALPQELVRGYSESGGKLW